jgi:hypothetical protein
MARATLYIFTYRALTGVNLNASVNPVDTHTPGAGYSRAQPD